MISTFRNKTNVAVCYCPHHIHVSCFFMPGKRDKISGNLKMLLSVTFGLPKSISRFQIKCCVSVTHRRVNYVGLQFVNNINVINNSASMCVS